MGGNRFEAVISNAYRVDDPGRLDGTTSAAAAAAAAVSRGARHDQRGESSTR